VLFFVSAAGDKSDDETEKFIPLSPYRRKHNPHWYGRRIAKFGRAGKVVSQFFFHSWYVVLFYFLLYCDVNVLSDFTLLVGHQEEHSACKNVIRCWHGYLFGVSCNDLHTFLVMPLPPCVLLY